MPFSRSLPTALAAPPAGPTALTAHRAHTAVPARRTPPLPPGGPRPPRRRGGGPDGGEGPGVDTGPQDVRRPGISLALAQRHDVLVAHERSEALYVRQIPLPPAGDERERAPR